jgi:hypothetical protein
MFTKAKRRNIAYDAILREEYRLAICKTSVHTLQEIHYISATDPSRLMLCKI